MELMKKNIHMDRSRLQATTQISLEEDLNIPESKPDVDVLIYQKGQVQIEEVKPTADHVGVKGKLLFHILYQSKEEGKGLVCVEGKIPFEEQMYMEGVLGNDNVKISCHIEDLTASTINTRKLSIQALLTLKATVEELFDVEVPVDIYREDAEGEFPVEYRKKTMEVAQIAIQKNDIFRVREEVPLPSNYPNIFQILWENVSLEDVEFRPMDEKLAIHGEIHIFILYESEGEEQTVRAFETTVPLTGSIECHGCREGMTPDIQYEIGNMDLEVRPDFDGEQRMLGLDMVLDIGMKMYEEEKVDVLTDIYGITKEVEAVTNEASLKRLLMKIGGKSKIGDRLKVKNTNGRILQLLHSQGNVQVDGAEITPEGIEIQGNVEVQVLYVTGDDGNPYNSIKGIIPFTYHMDVEGINPKDSFRLSTKLEQLQVTTLDSEELDVKGVLGFSATIFQNIPTTLISALDVQPLDMEKINDLPGMVAYVVAPGDNLWNIGKQYYVPVEKIREVNGLTGDELKVGEKLLIVKGA
ncbi:MAG: DUF3794 domain-containing protein [Lachnospiraceae bacterium]|nr:DUF3794 domain-containing protein [Lachnospiraceae bacterium]